jgi:hypothetical protein
MSIQDTLQRQGLLFLFDISYTQIRSILTAHYSKDEMVAVRKEARQAFDALIPQVPDIGGWRNPYTIHTCGSVVLGTLSRRKGAWLICGQSRHSDF